MFELRRLLKPGGRRLRTFPGQVRRAISSIYIYRHITSSIGTLTSSRPKPSLEVVLCRAHPTSGGVTASTEMLAAKRHAGVHTPVIVGKMINQQMAYAA